MVAAALADGRMAIEERQAIQRHLSDSPLSSEQTSQIHRDMVLPPTPAELAAMLSSAEEVEVVYRFAALVARADSRVAELERTWLDQLASALDIDPARRQELEEEILS
jgi:uncharacterized membrane protein YebE (DUF533 family)